MKQKYYVELNRQEWRLIIEGLNRFRNKLIAAGRYTDAVDEIFQSRQGKAAEVNVVGMEALMMEKYITDERTGLKYELVGDYYLVVGDDEPEEDQPIGIWGQRHLHYLKRHYKVIYANLLTSGKLPEYLADIDRQAEELFLRLAKQTADAEGITELSKEKVTDLPWKMEDEDRPRILIGVGRDDPIKGFWHLIKAFYLVQKEIPQMRLIIMGDGSFEQAKSLVSELQLEQKVYFPGVRKNPYKYLAVSEMFLLSSYTEGFPNVLVEAMILGRPLISTDCRTGPAEILEHGKYGILVPDMGDTEDYSGDTISEKETYFAEKIIEVLKDSERQKELSELERKRAGEFDYDSYVDNLLKLCYNKSL